MIIIQLTNWTLIQLTNLLFDIYQQGIIVIKKVEHLVVPPEVHLEVLAVQVVQLMKIYLFIVIF